VTRSERRDTTSGGNLIARGDTQYDNRGRVYQQIRYAVDPSTGSLGNSLTDKFWYDGSGRLIKSKPAGSGLFEKLVYDGVGG